MFHSIVIRHWFGHWKTEGRGGVKTLLSICFTWELCVLIFRDWRCTWCWLGKSCGRISTSNAIRFNSWFSTSTVGELSCLGPPGCFSSVWRTGSCGQSESQIQCCWAEYRERRWWEKFASFIGFDFVYWGSGRKSHSWLAEVILPSLQCWPLLPLPSYSGSVCRNVSGVHFIRWKAHCAGCNMQEAAVRECNMR